MLIRNSRVTYRSAGSWAIASGRLTQFTPGKEGRVTLIFPGQARAFPGRALLANQSQTY